MMRDNFKVKVSKYDADKLENNLIKRCTYGELAAFSFLKS